MSLINQMLRDLEKRRKTDGRLLPSGENPTVVGSQASSRRLLYLMAGGLVLIALVWFALELFPTEKIVAKPTIKLVPQDEKSQRIAIVRGQELFAALQEGTVQQPTAVETTREQNMPAVADSTRAQVETSVVGNTVMDSADKLLSAIAVSNEKVRDRPETAVKSDDQPSVRQPIAVTEPLDTGTVVEKSVQEKAVLVPRLNSRAAGGNVTSTLLNLGVLESVGSARLMFEFEQLPEYRWEYRGKEKQQLLIQFKKTAVRQALSIPQLKGPLLNQVTLQPEKESLQLLIDASKQVKVQALELPADPFHGHRLLLELYLQQSLTTVELTPPISSSAKGTTDKQSTNKGTAKKVSKKEKSLSREEQAQQAYKAALDQLQREDLQAAEANLSHALIMQPRLLEARLQLIDLLLNLQRASEAEKQMELGLQLHPDNPELRKKYARQLLASGQPEGALNVLQSEPMPEISVDLEYHALLAALQQESGQHKAAVRSYSRLLKFRPREALWWMGLAISYDQAEDYARAKEAYRQALSLTGLRPDLQDYIRNRLQIL